MTKKLTAIQGEFRHKIKVLDKAKNQLKKEFIGIDDIIDELIDNVRSWYTMNNVQEKPAIINLWGLTGVGKTSLAIRLTELIDYNDMTYRIDLGEKQGNMSFRQTIGDLCEGNDDEPIVILLDEFQHSKTVHGPFRAEADADDNRKVWELIDTGRLSFTSWRRGIFQLEELRSKLKKLMLLGVHVKEGLVIKNKKLFISEMDHYYERGAPIKFISPGEYQVIMEMAGKELGLELFSDVEKKLLTLDACGSIDFLDSVIRIAKKPHIKDFSRALIIVLGNVDEAYTMSSNYLSLIHISEPTRPY